MGSSESKMTKSDLMIKNQRMSRLIDPRSPSAGIDRTPIQVGGPVSKISAELKSECPLASSDPRSPTVGISRTPVREVMRVTVGSLARRLGILFHNEAEIKDPSPPLGPSSVDVGEDGIKGEELASSQPLLTPQPSQTFGTFSQHANLQSTPVLPPLQSMSESSPFVLLETPQMEVEIETEADISLEEAEEARESSLHKRLSMSLITCHEGATSSQIFAEVRHDSPSSLVPSVEVEPLRDGIDHLYALPSVNTDPECPKSSELPITSTANVSPVAASPEEPDEAGQMSCSSKTDNLAVAQNSLLPAPTTSELPSVPSSVSGQEQLLVSTGIRCPTFDSKSPSQVVFKPQWLGKGFGSSGMRARGVQGRGGKGGSSPLAIQVAVKNAANEYKGQSTKLKQKGTGLSEGRSPLQVLKETNSPRDQRPQMKLKVSTPDRQRPGQMERRVLTVALDKENR